MPGRFQQLRHRQALQSAAGSQMLPGSSVTDPHHQAPQQTSADQDAESSRCLSLDDDLIAWLADNLPPTCADDGNQLDSGLTGLLEGILTDTDTNIDAAAETTPAQVEINQHVQVITSVQQDAVNPDYVHLLNQLEQLNGFGRPM